ncbi:hypothetical protein [Alteromonas stellipolaris]|nr:hypothetical protein [Alteromonas stellipolaris]
MNKSLPLKRIALALLVCAGAISPAQANVTDKDIRLTLNRHPQQNYESD